MHKNGALLTKWKPEKYTKKVHYKRQCNIAQRMLLIISVWLLFSQFC